MNSTTELRSTRIGASDLERSLAAGERFQLIDVRSLREFEDGHLPRAVNIPLEQLDTRESDLSTDPVVLVCQTGQRAEIARRTLSSRRDDLLVLEHGTKGWKEAGFPLVGGRGGGLPLMRQVQIGAGSLVALGAILALTADPRWAYLSLFVGLGLLFAGITGFCGLATLLAAAPWNRRATRGGATAPACSN